MIHFKNLSKAYEGRTGAHDALHEVTLHIERGDIFGIIGQSGAGKSTLVRCINLLERPTSGSVVIDGVDVTAYEGKNLRFLRADIGMVFQGFSLFQQRDVLANVAFPLELRGVSKASAEAKALDMLALVGLADKAAAYPCQLSGGQQQRVAIARALANDPKILLCDEATSALDTMTTHAILSLLRDINEQLGVTVVVITHSLSVARRICDKVAVIEGGRLVETGFVEDVLGSPRSDAARLLIEADGGVSASWIAAKGEGRATRGGFSGKEAV